MNSNSQTKTVEQLRQEAAAAQEALQAAEKDAQEKAAAIELAEKQEAERQRREKLRDAPEPVSYVEARKHFTAIQTALRALLDANAEMKPHFTMVVPVEHKTITETEQGPQVSWVYPQLRVKHRGNDTYTRIDFKAEMETGSRFSYRTPRHTGRMRCTVGCFGDSVSLPQKKDGTFSYDKIAEKLYHDLIGREHDWQKKKRELSNSELVLDLRAEFKLPDYSTVVSATYARRSGDAWLSDSAEVGKVYLQVPVQQVTEAQARAIMQACIDAGVKLN